MYWKSERVGGFMYGEKLNNIFSEHCMYECLLYEDKFLLLFCIANEFLLYCFCCRREFSFEYFIDFSFTFLLFSFRVFYIIFLYCVSISILDECSVCFSLCTSDFALCVLCIYTNIVLFLLFFSFILCSLSDNHTTRLYTISLLLLLYKMYIYVEKYK